MQYMGDGFRASVEGLNDMNLHQPFGNPAAKGADRLRGEIGRACGGVWSVVKAISPSWITFSMAMVQPAKIRALEIRSPFNPELKSYVSDTSLFEE